MKWCEVDDRHYDVSLGCYWPSDVWSEGRSSAVDDPGSLSHDDVDG